MAAFRTTHLRKTHLRKTLRETSYADCRASCAAIVAFVLFAIRAGTARAQFPANIPRQFVRLLTAIVLIASLAGGIPAYGIIVPEPASIILLALGVLLLLGVRRRRIVTVSEEQRRAEHLDLKRRKTLAARAMGIGMMVVPSLWIPRYGSCPGPFQVFFEVEGFCRRQRPIRQVPMLRMH